MSFGPWTDGPSPITDSTTFTHADHAPRFYSDPDPKFGGIVGELTWNPGWFIQRRTQNIYLDGDPRYQQMWDLVRGVDEFDIGSGLLLLGNSFAIPDYPSDPWNVALLREGIELTGANEDQWFSNFHTLGSSLYYSVYPWPPGAIGFEYEADGGYGQCIGTVRVAWDAPTWSGESDPTGDSGEEAPYFALADIADIGGISLADFGFAPGPDTHYPYDLLAAMSPPPASTLDFVNGSVVHALPDALLNYPTPPAFINTETLWRGENVRFQVDFTMTFPRYRFIFAEDAPRLIYPRSDAYGARVYPPPNNPQRSGRFGSAAPL